MLTIFPPEIVERGEETVLQAKFECEDASDTLWFSTTNEFGGYLCHERGDAFLVAMLLYAMKKGEDIRILAPVSERLYYTVTKHLVRVLAEILNVPQIKIICDLDDGKIENAGAVGTGFSCGIDSFCTVIEHMDESCPPHYRLTHLTFFNVGASGDYGGEEARELFRRRIEAVKPCAEELGLPLVTLDSNISEILSMNFVQTHTYRNVAAALALQKLFNVYYYSSTYSLKHFELSGAPSYYDIYILDMLSTNNIKFYSTGKIYSRVEKTEIVSHSTLSHKYLNVCVADDRNCSRCNKCQRALLTLDVLGKLELYDEVFDLNDYRVHRSKYFGKMLSARRSEPFQQEIYDAIKERDYHIPTSAHLYRCVYTALDFGVKYCPQFIRESELIRSSYRKLIGNKL